MNGTVTPPSTRPVWLDWITSSYRVVPLGLWQSLAAIAIGLVACFLIVLAVADHPLEAFGVLVGGAFRNAYSFGSMLAIATVLGLVAFGSALGFRAGAFNIGTEGQLVMGGLAAALVAVLLPGPGWLVATIALVVSALVGAIWILIPALLRVFARTNELLTTLMMNSIATFVAVFLVVNYFKNPTSGAVETNPIPEDRWLLRILPPSNANVGIVLLVVIAVGLWFLFTRTRVGIRMEAAGLQPAFAQYIGVPAGRYLLVSLLGSAALCGLAGGVAILGISHVYMTGFSPQYGFLGITVALIGRLRPMGILGAAFLYAALVTGASAMQVVSDVPFALVYIMQGILILLITSQRKLRGGA